MGRDVSIAISAKDNFSSAITTMRNASQHFSKDLEGTKRKLDELNRTKTILKADTSGLQKALKDAEKQYQKTGDAADRLKLELAGAEYENARRNLNLVSKSAREAEKDILNMTGALSKAENRAGGNGNGLFGKGSGETGILKSLSGAGLTQMVGQSLSGALSAGINSAFGDTTGSMVNSVLSSTVSGAALGTAAMPGIGTAIGATVGLVAGGIDAATRKFEREDDAFIAFKQEQYQKQTERMQSDLTEGTAIASQREQYFTSFETMLGDAEKGATMVNDLKDFADKTPFGLDTLASGAQMLLSFGLPEEGLMNTIRQLGDVSGGNVQRFDSLALAFAQVQSAGKLSGQDLLQFINAGFNPLQILSEHGAGSMEELKEAMSEGQISAELVAKAFEYATQEGGRFYQAMEQQSQTFSGLSSTLEDNQNNVKAAMGEGYTEEREKGIREQIAYFEGEGGRQEEEASRLIGEYYASLENLKEEYEREAVNIVFGGADGSGVFEEEAEKRFKKLQEEYQKAAAEENGAEAGRILAEARSLAEMEYNNSTGAQNELKSQMELIQNIGEDASLHEEYYNAGIKLGDELSRGILDSFERAQKEMLVLFSDGITYVDPEDQERLRKHLQDEGVYVSLAESSGGAGSPSGNAWGLSYVPYDNFPALLHQGERVLTASENRNYGNGGDVSVTVSGNTFTVRTDDDIDRIARKIASEVAAAQRVT